MALAATAVAIGAGAWSGPFWALPLALVFPAVWVAADSRFDAAVIAVGYQLAGTRGAPVGIARYYDTVFAKGVVLWLLAAAVVGFAWAVLWRTSRRRRLLSVPLAFVMTAVPPIGIVGWVHPLTAAGALFPGWGWFGLAGTLAVALALAALPRLALLAVAGVLLGWAILVEAPTAVPSGWRGIDTHHGFGTGAADPLRDYERQLALIEEMKRSPARVLLFPESAGGLWTRASDALWVEALAPGGHTVLLGAEIPEADGRSANALVEVNARGSCVVYRQRMPVPLSMWRPWSHSGTRAYGFAHPVVTAGGLRAAVLICHEQVLVWPILHSLALRPDIVIGCANAWWCGDTTIPAVERNSTLAWARLFGRPCVLATNR